MKVDLSRRNLFRNTLIGAGGLLSARSALGQLLDACGLTPEQTIGPFFPETHKEDEDTDLTFVKGHRRRALGQVVYVRGYVLDEDCHPVPNAEVEIWQANWKGRYDHSGDRERDPARPFDPNFQYWGIATTDGKGVYGFKTVIPGAYPAGGKVEVEPGIYEDWYRPPHIHWKVTARGYHDLITQSYFTPHTFDFSKEITPAYIEKLNRVDRILNGEVKPGERDRVIVDYQPAPAGLERGAKLGRLDIVVRKVQ